MNSEHRSPATAPYILIVEDDPSIADMLVTVLTMQGYQTRALNSATAVLQFFAHATARTVGTPVTSPTLPDLMLLDLQLPEMDGEELIRRLRLAEHSLPPVLVVSAKRRETAARMAHNIGASGVLHKPFQVEELLDRIATTLRNAAERS